MAAGLPILLYHDLESDDLPNEKQGVATSDTVVRIEKFEAQMDYLCDHGFNTLSLQDYLHSRHNSRPLPPRPVIITFDDGHLSNYHIAFKLLQRRKMRATFFIIADRVGTDHHLNAAQLREMAAAGMEIGSHGETHRYLPLLSAEEIDAELKDSKQVLEKLIDRRIEFFAFPGGHYHRQALKLLRRSGYTGACSCHVGLNTAATNPYLLKRLEVRKRVNLDDFSSILSNRALRLFQVVDTFKATLRRAVGLKRYIYLREKLYRYYMFKR